jgi:hypothetical protein
MIRDILVIPNENNLTTYACMATWGARDVKRHSPFKSGEDM